MWAWRESLFQRGSPEERENHRRLIGLFWNNFTQRCSAWKLDKGELHEGARDRCKSVPRCVQYNSPRKQVRRTRHRPLPPVGEVRSRVQNVWIHQRISERIFLQIHWQSSVHVNRFQAERNHPNKEWWINHLRSPFYLVVSDNEMNETFVSGSGTWHRPLVPRHTRLRCKDIQQNTTCVTLSKNPWLPFIPHDLDNRVQHPVTGIHRYTELKISHFISPAAFSVFRNKMRIKIYNCN